MIRAEGQGCGAANTHFGFQRKEMLWPEVTTECFPKVTALQLDQKDNWDQRGSVKEPDARGRAVSHLIMTILFPKTM